MFLNYKEVNVHLKLILEVLGDNTMIDFNFFILFVIIAVIINILLMGFYIIFYRTTIPSIISNLVKFIIKRLKRKSFGYLFLVVSACLGIILSIYSNISNKHPFYIIVYYLFVVVSFFLIKTVNKVIILQKKSGRYFQWEFFICLVVYIAYILIYIALFTILYLLAFWSGDGSLEFNGVGKILDTPKTIALSSFTLFSYDIGYMPLGFMNLFMSLQLFISQIIIFGFLLVLLMDFIRGVKE